MRLICPNCDAQYNVSDDAIPEGGRDVQCSNCQHTWFQTEKPVVPGREKSQIVAPVISKPVSEPRQVSVPVPVHQPKKKPLDSAVAEILRQEAMRAQPPAPEPAVAPPPTQANTRIQKVDAAETRARIARMTDEEGGTRTGTATPAAPSAATTDANLRTIPDITEINAALRARAQAGDRSGLTEAEKQEAIQRSGFRRGFFLVLMLFAILAAPYFFADQITKTLPQTSSFMASYIETVDQFRLWLTTQTAPLRDMISGGTAG